MQMPIEIKPERIKMTMSLAEFLAERFGKPNVEFDKRSPKFTFKCVDVACDVMFWFDKHKGDL